ncbi:MAG: alginate lyase family protein, partial [bacterium]
MKLLSLMLMLSVGLVAAEVAPQAAAPTVMTSTFYGVRPGSLEKAKALMARGDKDAVAVIKNLTKEADKVLDDKPLTVTEKKLLAPSGDKHDYVSLSPYRWPNPATADGLPYILKDGEVNPESRDFDNSDSGRGLALAKAMRVT